MNYTYKDIKLDNILNKKTGIISINEYINNTPENIHKLLYDDALSKYSLTVSIDNYLIIEKPNTEYYLPSKIILIDKIDPSKRKIVDLEPYWNFYVRDIVKNQIKPIVKDVDLTNCELISIDYLRGKARFTDKIENVEFDVSIKSINSDTIINENASLVETFNYKINELNK